MRCADTCSSIVIGDGSYSCDCGADRVTIPCHTCSDDPGHDEHGNKCPRCNGTTERSAAEARAHLALIAARRAEDEARVAYRMAPDAKRYAMSKLVDVAVQNVGRRRDEWEAELSRVAAERAESKRPARVGEAA